MEIELQKFTKQELKDELDRREKLTIANSKPQQINPNYEQLKKTCSNYIDFVASPKYHEDNDWEIWIYEVAMEALYGDKIWDWINDVTK